MSHCATNLMTPARVAAARKHEPTVAVALVSSGAAPACYAASRTASIITAGASQPARLSRGSEGDEADGSEVAWGALGAAGAKSSRAVMWLCANESAGIPNVAMGLPPRI